MDPAVPLDILLHPDDHTKAERREALRTLRGWLTRGGFAPEAVDSLPARTLRYLGLGHLAIPCRPQRDERDAGQHHTHVWGVVNSDRFLSGWGGAEGGTSFAVWACTIADLAAVEKAVRNRSDARRVHTVDLRTWRRPRTAAHVSIYAVGPDHPARTGSFR